MAYYTTSYRKKSVTPELIRTPSHVDSATCIPSHQPNLHVSSIKALQYQSARTSGRVLRLLSGVLYDIDILVNKRNCNNTLGRQSNRVSKLQSPRVGPQSTSVVIDSHIDVKKVTEGCYMSPSADSMILGEHQLALRSEISIFTV